MKIGERFFEDNFGTKLEYEVDSINENGTFNAHLVKVHGVEYATEIDAIESVSDMADTPVEEVKEDKPKTTTAKATNAPKRTYNRKTTTTKK